MTKLPLNQIIPGDCKIVFTLALILLTSCKPFSANSDSYISKQEAMDAALEIASTSRPEISSPQEKPSDISAEQTTLEKALKHINRENEVASGYDPNLIVWFVKVDGLWFGEMSAPGIVPTTEPVSYHHYAIIIDAKTGLEIESSLSP